MAKKSENPTVSVVVPTYNRAHLLGRTIHSVLNQTFKDFELIVVDDGSTDNTEEVVKSFADKRIHYIRQKENRGEAAARNMGIQIARGEYIASHDDDDVWLPQKLEKQIKAFERVSHTVGVVYTGMERIEVDRKIYYPPSKVTQKEGNIHKELLKGCFLGHPTVLVRKECFEQVGMYDERLSYCVDWDMWLRVSKHYDFKFIDESLVVSCYTPVSMSSNQSTINRGTMLLLAKHFQDFRENDKESLARHYFNLGAGLCMNSDLTQLTEGRRCLLKAARICPLHLEYILVGLVSLSGPALFHNRPIRKLYRQLKKILGRA